MASLNQRRIRQPAPEEKLVPVGRQGKKFSMEAISAYNEFHNMKHNKITPKATPNTLANGANVMQFELGVKLGRIQETILEFVLGNNAATPATAQITTLTSTLYTAAGQSNATAGTFRIHFPTYDVVSPVFAFNETAANVQIALRLLDLPNAAAITVANALSAAAMTITTPGDLKDVIITVETFGWLAAAGAPAFINVAITTPYAANDAMIVGASPVVIKQINIIFKGDLRESIEGPQIFEFYNKYLTNDQLTDFGDEIGFDYSTLTSTNYINVAGTLTLRIPFYSVLSCGQFVPAHHPLCDVIVEVITNDSNAIFEVAPAVTSGRNNLTLTSAALWVYTREDEQALTDLRKAEKGLGAFGMRYLHLEAHRLNHSAGIVTGTAYELSISNHGTLIEANFAVLPQTKTTSADYLFPVEMQSIRITDNSGNSIIGNIDILDRDMKKVILPKLFPDMSRDVIKNINIYEWPASKDPRRVYKTGQKYGGYQMTGFDKFRFVPNATNAAAHEVIMYSAELRILRIYQDGHTVLSE